MTTTDRPLGRIIHRLGLLFVLVGLPAAFVHLHSGFGIHRAMTSDSIVVKEDAAGYEFLPSKQLATLANDQVSESSGIAVSRRHPNVFWTHNDSGDGPRIFAFDDKGRDLATVTIQGAGALDWEDMASYTKDGKHYLLLADVGDNPMLRRDCQLYIIEEPELRTASVPLVQTIRFRYENDPKNCESVAVDATENKIYLVSKVVSIVCSVYELPIPDRNDQSIQTAKSIAKLSVPLTTAMDLSADGQRAVVLTYANAFEYAKQNPNESWAEAFSRSGREIALPMRSQGEAICYGQDDHSLYLTSERAPTPLFVVPARKP